MLQIVVVKAPEIYTSFKTIYVCWFAWSRGFAAVSEQ